MSLRDRHQSHRDLHVQWADEAKARGGAFLHRLSVAHDEVDCRHERNDETGFPPPGEVSRARPGPPILQQTLSTPPNKWRDFDETVNYDEYSEEEKLEWRNNNNSTPSCSTSGSTCSGTYSDDDDDDVDKIDTGREFRDRQTATKVMREKGLRNSGGNDALLAAPVHASSSLLSQSPSPLISSEQESIGSSADHNTLHDREACTLQRRPGQHDAWPPSHSPELSPPDSSSPHRAGKRSEYSLGCALEPDVSPQNVAVCRSTNSDSISPAPSPQPYYYSSTTVHEPRARCGCRGLTVRVDSGPLGLSLEASYRIEEGFVLKQAWSDCAADSGMFTHTVHVQKSGKRDDGHIGALDLGLKGRSSSSGLIKVRRVDLESGGGATGVLVRPPFPLRSGNTSTIEARSSAAPLGVLEVEYGDILVRVDDVQVRKRLQQQQPGKVMLLCRLRGKQTFSGS